MSKASRKARKIARAEALDKVSARSAGPDAVPYGLFGAPVLIAGGGAISPLYTPDGEWWHIKAVLG